MNEIMKKSSSEVKAYAFRWSRRMNLKISIRSFREETKIPCKKELLNVVGIWEANIIFVFC